MLRKTRSKRLSYVLTRSLKITSFTGRKFSGLDTTTLFISNLCSFPFKNPNRIFYSDVPVTYSTYLHKFLCRKILPGGCFSLSLYYHVSYLNILIEISQFIILVQKKITFPIALHKQLGILNFTNKLII
jgi:hypothetical protein